MARLTTLPVAVAQRCLTSPLADELGAEAYGALFPPPLTLEAREALVATASAHVRYARAMRRAGDGEVYRAYWRGQEDACRELRDLVEAACFPVADRTADLRGHRPHQPSGRSRLHVV